MRRSCGCNRIMRIAKNAQGRLRSLVGNMTLEYICHIAFIFLFTGNRSRVGSCVQFIVFFYLISVVVPCCIQMSSSDRIVPFVFICVIPYLSVSYILIRLEWFYLPFINIRYICFGKILCVFFNLSVMNLPLLF